MNRTPVALVALVLALGGCAAPGAPSTASQAPTQAAAGGGVGGASAAPAAGDAVLWPDNATVSHIFYHPLVVDPARAFAADNPDAPGLMQYMVTIGEFKAQLVELHARGYVLVHPQRLARRDAAGVMHWTPLSLPPGKKPLVLSIDDVSYNSNTVGNGFASNLTLDAAGKVTNTYTDAAGTTTTGSFDVSTVLDDFVAAHPDFSLEGDKGTIALTGYEGVLGYRSSPSVHGDTAETRAQAAQAKAVADALKATGWKFASHSFGHRDYGKLSLASLKADDARWHADVEPVVGETDMIVYAYGADIEDATRYARSNAKFAYLSDQGFDYFFNVDASVAHWVQLRPDSMRMGRINIDGITLSRAIEGRQDVLPLFFDAKAVIDPLRPLPTPGA